METYTVKSETFEGPLDLLLQLIENRKLHINDVSLAQITDDYLAHIEKLETFPLREAAHFILVASTLVLIKSRSLLPTLTLTEEEEGDIQELERRLKEYKRIKELSGLVGMLFNKRVIWSAPQSAHIVPVFSPTKKITIATVRECIERVLSLLPKSDMIPQVFIKKMVSLEEMIARLLERVTKNLHVTFSELKSQGAGNKVNIIVSFLAVLELVKRGRVLVRQSGHFEDIVISKT